MEKDKHAHCCDHDPKPEAPQLGVPAQGSIETVLHISGADCADEVNAIKNAFSAVGISAVSVNLIGATVTVQHPSDFSSSQVVATVESTGVKVVDDTPQSFLTANRTRILLVAASGILLLTGIVLEWQDLVPPTALIVIFGIATLLGGSLVFPKAWRALKQKSLDMNVLMSVAVIGAFAIREYSEAATVVALFSFAELLEAFSVDRARKAIREVLKLTPQVAWKKDAAGILSVPVLQLVPGDIILVKPGESIPLDGNVIEGTSSVNQAPVTGESLVVSKKSGDPVFAGTINENGTLTIEVTKGFKDTKISRVMKLIEEAQDQKAPSERFVDKFAKIYTPAVFVLAILVVAVPTLFLSQSFDVWIYRALVLLVIACPCALVLATPISVVSGLASLARRGVLVKGGIHLESLGKIKAIALDKTGTLTEGKFKVQSLQMLGSESEERTIQLALSLEKISSHPLAQAILEFATARNIKELAVEDFTAVPGRGADGRIESHLYFVGNHRYAHELGVCTPVLEDYLKVLEDKAQSVVIIGHKPHDGHQGEVLAVFALGDTIKENAKNAIEALHKAGVEKVIVLSGDNQKTVDAISRALGIDEAIGDLLPEDKVEKVKELTAKYKQVAMVGDGINDAPALAHATVGISMGAAGTDAAIETSDVALMQDNLAELPKAISQGRRVLNVIRFNIGFALATKIIFLGLAIAGYSNLWLAVAADLGASVFVTLNALRLLRVSGRDA